MTALNKIDEMVKNLDEKFNREDLESMTYDELQSLDKAVLNAGTKAYTSKLKTILRSLGHSSDTRRVYNGDNLQITMNNDCIEVHHDDRFVYRMGYFFTPGPWVKKIDALYENAIKAQKEAAEKELAKKRDAIISRLAD